MSNQFKIVVAANPAQSSIEMNGAKLNGVRRISFDVDGARKNGPSCLTLEIYGEALVEGEYVEQQIFPPPSATEALERFNAIIDTVEARCLAVDGPVTPTLQEITEAEMRDLWLQVQVIRGKVSAS